MFSVAIMRMLETMHAAHATHRDDLRPSQVAVTPAVPELRNAPRVISEEMSCWRVGVIFQPIAVFGFS
jgi:hypothetical protein